MRNILKKILLPILLMSTVISVGFSTWVVNNSIIELESAEQVKENLTKVAYLASDTNTYYTSIEKAVVAANNKGGPETVYVIPGTNPTITQSFTINSGVTLVFPFEEKYYHADSTNSSDKYAQANRAPSETVANRITIKDNISTIEPAITVNGNLYIGAINSYSHNTYLLNPLGGSVCVLDMGANNQIVVNNGGFIQCFGKIVNTNDTSLITVNSGGTIENQIQVYDWPGGTKATTDFYPVVAAKAYIFPFSKFDLPQINTPMVYNAGGLMKGCIRAEVGDQYFVERNGLTIIGNNGTSFINLGNNGVCYFNFDCETGENIGNGLANHSTYFELRSGDVSFGTLSLTVKMFLTVTISTNKASMPLPSGFTVKICSGVTCAYNISMYFAKGSKVIIDEGAKVTINCSNSGASYKGIVFLPGSEFINNSDDLSIAGPVGGLITTTKAGVKLSTGDISAVSGENKYVYAESLTSINPTSATILKNISGYLNNLQGNVLSSNSVTQMNLTANRFYESVQDESDPTKFYWSGNLVEADEAVLTLSSYESPGEEKECKGTATVEIGPSDASDLGDYKYYDWSITSGSGVYLGATEDDAINNKSIKITTRLTPENPTPYVIHFYAEPKTTQGTEDVTFKVIVKKNENDSTGLTATAKFKRKGSCLIEGTMITLADGSQKAVENILPGDELLVINHETGQYDTSPVIFNDSEPLGMYDVTYLRFSDGSEVGISYEHGFFDRTLNKYVYITNSNGEEYIGHEFYTENGYVTLDEVETVQEETRLYSPVTAWHLNYFTNGVLSMPGGIEGLFNIFEYEQDSLKYDEFLMQQDIDTYGLFTYDDFKDYCSYEFYSAFPAPYLKVSIGKGYITKEEIIRLIERYSKLV